MYPYSELASAGRGRGVHRSHLSCILILSLMGRLNSFSPMLTPPLSKIGAERRTAKLKRPSPRCGRQNQRRWQLQQHQKEWARANQWLTTSYSTPASRDNESSLGEASSRKEPDGGEPRYYNEPYVDSKTGRTVCDVSDLGITMEDIGKNPFTSDAVHPSSPDEVGVDSQGYVRAGKIDWDAMARDLMNSDDDKGE